MRVTVLWPSSGRLHLEENLFIGQLNTIQVLLNKPGQSWLLLWCHEQNLEYITKTRGAMPAGKKKVRQWRCNVVLESHQHKWGKNDLDVCWELCCSSKMSIASVWCSLWRTSTATGNLFLLINVKFSSRSGNQIFHGKIVTGSWANSSSLRPCDTWCKAELWEQKDILQGSRLGDSRSVFLKKMQSPQGKHWTFCLFSADTYAWL